MAAGTSGYCEDMDQDKTPGSLPLANLGGLMGKAPQEDSARWFPRPPHHQVVSIFPGVAEAEAENPNARGALWRCIDRPGEEGPGCAHGQKQGSPGATIPPCALLELLCSVPGGEPSVEGREDTPRTLGQLHLLLQCRVHPSSPCQLSLPTLEGR